VNTIEQSLVHDAVTELEELVGSPASFEVAPAGLDQRPDAIVRLGKDTFIIEARRSVSSSSVASAIQQIRSYVGTFDATPLLVVTYMPPSARDLAARHGVSWLDLSGNAHLRTPHTLIRIEGKPNRFISRGRPATPFAPKSSRVARWFLTHPEARISQQEISDATQVDPGQVSRIARRLMEDSLLRRTTEGRLYVPDPYLLLDAWRSEYKFEKHQIVRGHLSMSSADQGLRHIASALKSHGLKYAATGLAGAWLLRRYAGFRLVTVYVEHRVPDGALGPIGFHEEERGANVWFVIPNDAGYMTDTSTVEGIECAHPVQVYLDLAGQPERSEEAAEDLRPRLFSADFNA